MARRNRQKISGKEIESANPEPINSAADQKKPSQSFLGKLISSNKSIIFATLLLSGAGIAAHKYLSQTDSSQITDQDPDYKFTKDIKQITPGDIEEIANKFHVPEKISSEIIKGVIEDYKKVKQDRPYLKTNFLEGETWLKVENIADQEPLADWWKQIALLKKSHEIVIREALYFYKELRDFRNKALLTAGKKPNSYDVFPTDINLLEVSNYQYGEKEPKEIKLIRDNLVLRFIRAQSQQLEIISILEKILKKYKSQSKLKILSSSQNFNGYLQADFYIQADPKEIGKQLIFRVEINLVNKQKVRQQFIKYLPTFTIKANENNSNKIPLKFRYKMPADISSQDEITVNSLSISPAAVIKTADEASVILPIIRVANFYKDNNSKFLKK